ncbi:transposase [Desulfocicer niacini]
MGSCFFPSKVSTGGVNTRGEWVQPKYSSTFLFPVRALSNVFRAKLLNGLIMAQGPLAVLSSEASAGI